MRESPFRYLGHGLCPLYIILHPDFLSMTTSIFALLLPRIDIKEFFLLRLVAHWLQTLNSDYSLSVSRVFPYWTNDSLLRPLFLLLTRNTWVVGIIKWASFWLLTNQTWRVIILPKPQTEFERLKNTPLAYVMNFEPLYTSIPYWPSKWSLCFSPNSCSDAVAEAVLLFSHIACVSLLFVFIFLKLLMMPSILQLILEKEYLCPIILTLSSLRGTEVSNPSFYH